MHERGLQPDFSPPALAQARQIPDAPPVDGGLRDLTSLLWCSIDNDDSRDLDQLSAAEPGADGATLVRVAIADVDAHVPKGSPIDDHARTNTTSVYTPAQIFPMLPERLSTDLTSLVEAEPRAAIVVEMQIAADGAIGGASIVRAMVLNRAKLAYDAVAAWLDGAGPAPSRGTERERPGGLSAAAGWRRAGAAAAPPAPGSAVARVDAGARRVRRRSARRPAARPEEPGQGTDRGLHDRRQRHRRAVSRRQRPAGDPADAAHAEPVEPHRRGRARVRRGAAGRARRPRARRVSARTPRRRSRPLSRPLARRRQAARRWRVRRRATGRAERRPLRPRGSRLHPLDGAQPPLPRPRHPAPGEGRARRGGGAVLDGGAAGAGAHTARSRRTPPTRSSGR